MPFPHLQRKDYHTNGLMSKLKAKIITEAS